jgi:protein-tyrosine phosphatase
LIVEAEEFSAVETAHAGYGRLLHRFLASRMTDRCKRILFLCTGNYYRSRFVEELFILLNKKSCLGKHAPEALLKAGAGEHRTHLPLALEALQALGMSPRRADQLPLPCTLPDFRQADIVIGLKEAEHRSMVERRFPGHRGPGPELARGRSRCRRAL